MDKNEKGNSSKSLLALGLQFTSMIVTPTVVLVLGAMYLQDKYGYGDGVMIGAVLLSFLFMFTNLYSFVKSVLRLTKNSKGEIVPARLDSTPRGERGNEREIKHKD